MSIRKSLFFVLLSVTLLSLSLPPFDVGFLRYFALVPLLFCIAKTENDVSRIRRGLWLWLFAFLFLLWQYADILYLHPLDWTGIDNQYASIFTAAGLWFILAFCLSLAAFPLILPLSHRFFFLFPVLFVLWEYLRSFLYSIIVLGPDSLMADLWPFGFLGMSAHTSGGLLFFAPFVGIYGFSLFIALINLIVFYLLFGKPPLQKKMRMGVLAFLIAFLGAVEWMPFPEPPPADSGKSLRIIALNENNPVRFRYTNEYFLQTLPRRLDVLEEALSKHPDTQIVLFSENSQFLKTLETRASFTPEEIAGLLFEKQSAPRLIIDGDYDREKHMSVARAYMSGEEFSIYKDALMPFGEYQPYILKWMANIFGKKDFYDALSREKNTVRARSGMKTIKTEVGNIAIVACSEIFSSDTYRQIRRASPDIIVQQQRLAHFHNAPKLFSQTLALSQIRAAVLRKFIVGSVDGRGFSYVISPYGELIAESNDKDGYLYAEVPVY